VNTNNFSGKVSFIWSVADLLRGPYRPNQYKDVMLPMTMLRRLDCVLEPTKDKVLAKQKSLSGGKVKKIDPLLCRIAGVPFYNTSRYSFEKLKGDPNNIAANLTNFIKGFSSRAREIIENFGFEEHIGKLDKADRLYLLVSRFCDIDLHPREVSNLEMGYIFEELIRRFNEASNEEAGDHFTPREVIRLMVNLIFMPDSEVLTTRGIVKTLYDPACGTGGMLSVAEDYVRELNPDARLEVFGQDYNAQAYAICGSDMMIKGQDIEHIAYGDSFTDDRFSSHKFDYMLANPPFGVEWKPEADFIKREHEEQGFGGRFGAGLPRINDGSLLFLQHMISKMKDPTRLPDGQEEGGTLEEGEYTCLPAGTVRVFDNEDFGYRRITVERPLRLNFAADEERITRLAETKAFTNLAASKQRKDTKAAKAEIEAGRKLQKDIMATLEPLSSLGIVKDRDEFLNRLTSAFKKAGIKVPAALFKSVLMALAERDETAKVCTDAKGNPEPDPELRDYENVPLKEDVDEYMKREVLPHVPDLPAATPCSGEFCVYVLKCSDGSFYKGQTSDFPKRFAQHREGEVSWTAKNLPIEPIHWEIYDTKEQAIKREKFLKTGKGREWLKRHCDEKRLKSFERQAGAWIDESKTKIGYEINFNRYFYKYTPPRPLEEIETDLKKIEKEIADMLAEVTE